MTVFVLCVCIIFVVAVVVCYLLYVVITSGIAVDVVSLVSVLETKCRNKYNYGYHWP